MNRLLTKPAYMVHRRGSVRGFYRTYQIAKRVRLLADVCEGGLFDMNFEVQHVRIPRWQRYGLVKR